MVVLLSVCKQEEGKVWAETHRGQIPPAWHQPDAQPQPTAAGKTLAAGDPATNEHCPDWACALNPCSLSWPLKFSSTCYLRKHEVVWICMSTDSPTSLLLQVPNRAGKVTPIQIIYFYHHFPSFFSPVKVSWASSYLTARVIMGGFFLTAVLFKIRRLHIIKHH